MSFKEGKRLTVSNANEKQPGNLATWRSMVIFNRVLRAADSED